MAGLSGATAPQNFANNFAPDADAQAKAMRDLIASRRGPVADQGLFTPMKTAQQAGYDQAATAARRKAQWANLQNPAPFTYQANADLTKPGSPAFPAVPGTPAAPGGGGGAATPAPAAPAPNPNANPIQGNTNPSNADGAGYRASGSQGVVQVGNPLIEPGNINSAAYFGYQPGNQVGPYSTGKMPSHGLWDAVPVPEGASPETAKLLEGLTYSSFMQPNYGGFGVAPAPYYKEPTATIGGSGNPEVGPVLQVAPNYPGWDMYRTESNTGAITNMSPAELQARQQQTSQQYQAWMQATGYRPGDQWFTGQNMGHLHSQGQ
jgi:hypothetical protein